MNNDNDNGQNLLGLLSLMGPQGFMGSQGAHSGTQGIPGGPHGTPGPQTKHKHKHGSFRARGWGGPPPLRSASKQGLRVARLMHKTMQRTINRIEWGPLGVYFSRKSNEKYVQISFLHNKSKIHQFLIIFLFFGRNSRISHLCATLDLRLHSGYPAGYPARAGYPAGYLAGCPHVWPDVRPDVQPDVWLEVIH